VFTITLCINIKFETHDIGIINTYRCDIHNFILFFKFFYMSILQLPCLTAGVICFFIFKVPFFYFLLWNPRTKFLCTRNIYHMGLYMFHVSPKILHI